MKEKNLIAEKLNDLNEFQYKLLEKEKEIANEEFLLKKAWQEIEDLKKEIENLKKGKQPKGSIIPDRPLKRTSIFSADDEKKDSENSSKK